MIKNKTISLVIPCRNEEKAISQLLRKLPSYIDEVIVVDNRSSDRTAQVARKLGAKVFPEKRTLDGIGYGFAHQKGLREATGDYIVALDGDDTYPVSKIAPIVKFMEREEFDFVSCNRFPLTNNKAISWIRQLGVFALNIEAALLYGFPFQDILTGMWIMNRKAAKKLSVKSGDWNYSPEIKLAALTDKELYFTEYHIPHFYRDKGQSKQAIWKTGFGHLLFIFKRWLFVDNSLVKMYKLLSFEKSVKLNPAFFSVSK